MAPATLETPVTETDTQSSETTQELKQKAKQLFHEGLKWSKISEETGVASNTLRVWGHRGKWKEELQEAKRLIETSKAKCLVIASVQANPSQKALQSSGNRLRTSFATVIEQSTAALLESPITNASELANTPERQGKAAVIKTLVDAAATVFDWSGQRNQGYIAFEQSTLADEPEAIDVQATPKQVVDTPKPEPEPKQPST